MPTYQREVRIDAPLDDVWDFHSRIEGLTAVTPDWMHLRVESVEDAGEDGDTEILTEGATVQLSLQPFGVGPRQGWTSHIVRRERDTGSAVFVDEMADGPFPAWRHTHAFYADGEGTILRDRVEYELPVVGGLLGPLGWVGFEPTFWDRHRRTRQILED